MTSFKEGFPLQKIKPQNQQGDGNGRKRPYLGFI
jgi:hypothetical protein